MADPLDILTGRVPQGGGDEWGATLGNLAAVIASIPERRARAAQLRARMAVEEQNAQTRANDLQLRQRAADREDAAKQKAAEMDQAVTAIAQGAMVDGPNGGKVLDRKRFIDGAGRAGVSPERLASILGTFDKIDESVGKAEKERLGHVADLIDGVLEHGADEQAMTLGLAVGKANGWLRDNELEPVLTAMGSGQDIKPMLSQIRDSIRGPKKHEVKDLGPGHQLRDEAGKLIAENPLAEKTAQPTPSSIAMEAAGGDAAKALSLMHQPAPMSAYQAEQLKLARSREAREAAKPVGSEKPPTGQQNRALGFFNRARQADDDLEAIEGDINALGVVGQERLKHAPNALQSEAGQKYHQARRAFTEARLRKDSGATIKDSEYEADEKTYFPQPFDSKEVLEQKRRARANVLASLAAEAGDSALRNFYGDDGPGLVDVYRSKSAKPQTKKNPFRP